GAQARRGDVRVGPPVGVDFRDPHLVLPHVRDDGAPGVTRLADRGEDRLGGETAGRRRRGRSREAVDVLEPALAAARLHRGEQPARDLARVAHDADIDRHVLADFRAVQIDVDDAGLPGEARRVAGDAVVESQPDADDHVGVLDCAVYVYFAVHAGHAQVQGVALRKGTDAEQRRDHGNTGLLRERPPLRVRL